MTSLVCSAVGQREERRARGSQPKLSPELNRSLVREGLGDKFLTLCYLEVRPVRAGVEITVSSGGHPLPLVRRAGGRVEAAGRAGLLLGVFPRVDCGQSVVELGPGDLMLLYTDGLIERRGVDPRLGERALRSALAGSADPGSAPGD